MLFRSGDFVEVLTTKAPRGPSRDWLGVVQTSKARSKIRAFFSREQREDAEHQGRDSLQEALRKAGLPSQRIVGSPLFAQVIQDMGFKRAEGPAVKLAVALAVASLLGFAAQLLPGWLQVNGELYALTLPPTLALASGLIRGGRQAAGVV